MRIINWLNYGSHNGVRNPYYERRMFFGGLLAGGLITQIIHITF